jgi:hypothetical protein
VDAPLGLAALGAAAAGALVFRGGAHHGLGQQAAQGVPSGARRSGDNIGVGQPPAPLLLGELGLQTAVARQGGEFHSVPHIR